MKMKVTILSILCILIAQYVLFSESRKETILLLPFRNTGANYKDLHEEVFNSHFYVYFKQLKAFHIIHPAAILNYRAEHPCTIEELYDIDVLNTLKSHFKADFILGGEYRFENETLKVILDIYPKKKITIQREFEIKIKTDVYDALYSILKQTTKTFSGYNPNTSVLMVTTDYPCSLYVDGIFFAGPLCI